MEQQVTYRGKPVGVVQIEEQAQGMCWSVQCSLVSQAVLRLYGLGAQAEPLRIGVLEPEGNVLTLRRVLSWQTLRDAGYERIRLPDSYVLDDGTPGCLDRVDDHTSKVLTGDVRIDALAASGQVKCVRQDKGWTVYAPFVSGREMPMAFALTACAVRDGQAVLCLPDRDGKPPFQERNRVLE